MSHIYQNLINGSWVDSDAMPNINPSNIDSVVGEYARASAAQTEEAIAAAKDAFPS